MTLEELKVEADKLGYKVVRKSVRRDNLVPCICGCKRRAHWYESKWNDSTHKSQNIVGMRCLRCGREVTGFSLNDVRRNWNLMIGKLHEVSS